MKTFGFQKSLRLLRTAEFQIVFSRSFKVVTKHAVFLFRDKKAQAQREPIGPRLGLVVSRKSIAKAVDRNRFKRRMREIFRMCVPTLPALDFVVIARKGAVGLSFLELKKAFFYGLSRADSATKKTNLTCSTVKK